MTNFEKFNEVFGFNPDEDTQLEWWKEEYEDPSKHHYPGEPNEVRNDVTVLINNILENLASRPRRRFDYE